MRALCFVVLLPTLACSESVPVDPEFEVGFVRDGVFMPLADGDACPVVDAIQGGYWIMPTMRLRGMGKSPTVGCAATDVERDITLGSTEGERNFSRSEDGQWIQGLFLLSLAGSINSSDDYSAVDGSQGTLSCFAISDWAMFEIGANVVYDAVSLDRTQ